MEKNERTLQNIKMVVKNIWFEPEKRQRYTRRKPGDKSKKVKSKGEFNVRFAARELH